MGTRRVSQATALLILMAVLLWAACTGGSPPTPLEFSGYLQEDIQPCRPAASSEVEPCEALESPWDVGEGSVSIGYEPRSARYYLGDGQTGWSRVAHLVVRGTYLPGTVRCAPVGPPARFPSWKEDNPRNYIRGTEIQCFADLRANEYVLGSGPPALTVMVERFPFPRYGDPSLTEEPRRLLERALVEGGVFSRDNIRVAPPGGLEGREVVLFLGPADDVSREAWQVVATWPIERRDDGTVIAVHPDRVWWRSSDDYQTYLAALEMELPSFRTAVQAAHQVRLTEYGGRAGPEMDMPLLETDANRLTQLFTSLGAYSHRDGPPSGPPPSCGQAVQGYSPDLMLDCQYLLAGRDTLRGTGALNWDTGTALNSWDGLTTGGTPARVTKVLLRSKSLTGSIPEELGELSGITHLDLSSNSLTTPIPLALGRLENLEEIRLSGNSLTGCIPNGLKDVATNDLSSLNLLYCPPAPSAPVGGISTETSLPLSWDSLAGVSSYRLEYREGITRGIWLVDQEVSTTTSTVMGLTCGTDYQFRLSAQGDGTTYAAQWGDPSESLTRTSAACTPPRWSSGSYRFSIAEDAPLGTVVGTVTATDNNGPVTYNNYGYGLRGMLYEWGYLTVHENTGAITVTGDLRGLTPHLAVDSLGNVVDMRIKALDQNGAVSRISVLIEIRESCDSGTAVPNPGSNPGLVADCKTLLSIKDALAGTATLTDDTFTLSWDAVSGSAKYEAQHTTDAEDAATVTWTALSETTGTTQDYTPAGGVACGTEYRFRVRGWQTKPTGLTGF